jgi:hypothetical protein
MNRKRVLKTVCFIAGIIFLLSILTVESHAREQGSLAAKLPTIIDGTIEFAILFSHSVEFHVFRAIEYLPVSLEIFLINKATTPLQLYRAPPSVTF